MASPPARSGVFFSGRFDGAFKERAIRAVAAEVRSRAPFVPVLIVDASSPQEPGYAQQTMEHLADMELMVMFAFEDYGQLTGNPYSTFREVKYCLDHQEEVRCLPLKLYGEGRWPPAPPDHNSGRRGAAQNGFFFQTDLLYREFPISSDPELLASKAAMADCIIDCYLGLHPERRRQDRRQKPMPTRATPEKPVTRRITSSENFAVVRKGVFFSGRFDGAFKEKAIRSVAEEVRSRAPFIEVLIVDASISHESLGYGKITMSLLAKMELMVPFVFADYGQRTGNPYCTYAEVNYCLEHQEEVRCLPLKLYSTQRWPPVPPDHDGGSMGAEQNEFFFKTDLLYREFPIHNEAELLASKAAMADCIIDRYLQMNPELRCRDVRQLPGTGTRRFSSSGTFEVGQQVQYYSHSKGRWFEARVEKSWGDGSFEISVMPGQHISPQDLKGGDQGDLPAVACETLHGPAAKMPFNQGDPVQHVSSSGGATDCKVLFVGADGCYLDIDPSAKVPFSSLRPRKQAAFKAGDAVLYNSVTNGEWIPTKVLLAHGNGEYEIEAKPGHRVSQELLKGVQCTEEPASPASRSTQEPASPLSSSSSPSSPKKFAVGQQIWYMVESKERGAWVANPTVIRAAHDDGTYEIEAEKGARIAANLLFELAAEH